jgi:intein/homing endonuclease
MYTLKEPIQKIQIGDEVKTISGTSIIKEITLHNNRHTVYNLSELKNDHNYFANGALVHNRVCFVKGTKVSISETEEINIEDIKIGDTVLSFNETLKVIEKKKVINMFSQIHDDLVKYTYSDGSSIISTFDHPFYVNGLELASYKPNLTNIRYNFPNKVIQIEVGDKLHSLNDDQIYLKLIEELERKETQTFIITVEDNHNFYANKILVHNKV